MLETACSAATEAGEILLKYFEMTGLERELKDDQSFVTNADKESEAIIVSHIQKKFPDHGILGEEGSDHNPQAEFQWIIDPLDGTHNFVNGIPIFGVSIGLVQNGIPLVGVVYNPITRSLYAAERGKGTTYNGKPVRVSDQEARAGLITIGPGKKEQHRCLELAAKAKGPFKSVRLLGSTAVELAYLARGGTEGFICLGLYKWDYVAGALLVEEAGGTITNFEGGPWSLEQNYFLASNGVAHDTLKELIQDA